MIIRLSEAIIIAVTASAVGTVIARHLSRVINRHFDHEDLMEEKERENAPKL